MSFDHPIHDRRAMDALTTWSCWREGISGGLVASTATVAQSGPNVLALCPTMEHGKSRIDVAE